MLAHGSMMGSFWTLVEKATDPSATELDWSLVFQICDVVNNTETGAKEARKLLQKKMLSTNPNTQVIALELLNALAENCRGKFQNQLSAKSFGEDLENLAAHKATDERVFAKLAQCLQNWVSQFGYDSSFQAVRHVHDMLMSGSAARPTDRRRGRQSYGDRTASDHAASQPRDAMRDVEVAKNNAQLLSQTLSFTDPTQEDITKNELIQSYQTIISNHLQTCDEPDVISALLEANNEFISTFKAYDDMLERSAVDQATQNSCVENVRGTRQTETATGTDANASEASASGAGESSSPRRSASPPLEQRYNPFKEMQSSPSVDTRMPMPEHQASSTALVDPFDPFADTNEVPEAQTSSGEAGHVKLPPPLTPTKMHN
ncbi:uncharacterized protein BYT42DRAFT_312460 [Radiomyces spectabilis]|uniref:uncharacterized protein n=1 Tax=Radiomyces spectabilis TaxID=64574 RepID=UPI0022207D6B|nr:uncharacterized protein BYT42DRAFT_312460 [Radiomyces spectabilis]KAI8379081.1 hypothetical protein BYT42DRAFT_312460 [Radiomyces spectabilis]